MSKILFVCYRNKTVPSYARKRMEMIEREILPDNINPNSLDLLIDDGIISCIFNPVALKQRQNKSICLGVANGPWWERESGNRVLDGSYAIIREDNQFVELQTDAVASRTLWYFVDDEKIIASNSQLAIIYFLGDFDFNKDVIPWILASGKLGPYLSWDSRIKFLKPQSKLILNKSTWDIKMENEPINIHQNKSKSLSTDQYLERLEEEIDKSTSSLPLSKKLLLPLSGGYDSRGILLSLKKNNKKISTITWGSKDAINHKNNDAYIAKKLAEHYHTDHNYVHTENSKINVKTVIERFLINSEGRVDHIGGYMDGFKIWKDIFENEYTAIIRGDECFGGSQLGLNVISDFNILNRLGYPQYLPKEFGRNTNESMGEWRDRLYHIILSPMHLGALNETKSAYIEISNPLLSYSILELVRGLPDALRDEKKLFRMYVENNTVPIPFATEGANIDYEEQLKKSEIVDYFVQTINNYSYELIDKDFIEEIILNVQNKHPKSFKSKNFKTKSFKTKIINKIKGLMPSSLKHYIRAKVKSLNHIDNNLLLFRIFIVYRMHQKINNTIKCL